MTGETILVIDTDTDTTQKMSTALEAEDFLVFTAPNGDVGITMAKKVNPSLIFINPAMPGTSGLDVCKAIHGIEQLKNIPIVVLSAFEGATDPRYTTVYGIVGSLKKPFTSEELVSKTRQLLSAKPAPAGADFSFGRIEEAEPDEEDSRVRRGFGDKDDLMDNTVVTSHDEDDFSDKTAVKMPGQPRFSDKELLSREEPETGGEKTEQFDTPDEELEKTVREAGEKTYTLKKSARRRSMRSPLLVPVVIVLVIVVLGAGGFIAYQKGMLPGIKPKAMVAVKPAPPAEQPATETAPVTQPETKAAASAPPSAVKPDTKAITTIPVKQETAPAPKTAAPSPAPATKPAGKAIYSVQVGAFKSSANADSLAQQLKGKGYDSFVQKGMKGQEAIFRVLVGKYENMKDASKTAKDVSAKEHIKAVVYKD